MPKSDEIINVSLTRDQWTAILRTIVVRQQDCRKVTPEFRTHQVFADLEVEYEKLKMNIAGQLPSA